MAVYFSAYQGLGNIHNQITHENYKTIILKIGISKLPQSLLKGHQFYSANIEQYNSNTSIKETINDYLNDLNTYVSTLSKKQQTELFKEDTGYSGHKWIGSHYKQAENLNSREIAKLIKKELEIEFEAEAKFSVTNDGGTSVSSIRVDIKDVLFNPYTEDFLKALKSGQTIHEYNQANKDDWNRSPERFNDRFDAFIKKVKSITNKYNFDDSDSQSDYFHVNYYSHVSFDEDNYLITHFPDSPDAKQRKEYDTHWNKQKTDSKAKADKNKGKFKKGEFIFYKAQMHHTWEKYKLPNGMYLAKIVKSPNGRALFSNYTIRILQDITKLKPTTLDYYKKNGEDKLFITNEYGTFYLGTSISGYEKDMIAFNSTDANPSKKKSDATKLNNEVTTVNKKEATETKESKETTNTNAVKSTSGNSVNDNKNIEKKNDKTNSEKNNKQVNNKNNNRKKDKPKKRQAAKASHLTHTKSVIQVSPSVKFIKRYADLDGKIISETQLAALIKSLQAAILNGQIRLSDPHAELIKHIQNELVKTYNACEPNEQLKFTIQFVDKYKQVALSETQQHGGNLLKRYVALIGSTNKEKQRNLLTAIDTFLKSNPSHLLIQHLQRSASSLLMAIHGNGKVKADEETLSGLQGLGFIPMMIAAAVGKGIEHLTNKALKPKEKTKTETKTNDKNLGCACKGSKKKLKGLGQVYINDIKDVLSTTPFTPNAKQTTTSKETTAIPMSLTLKKKKGNEVMSVSQALNLKFDLIGLEGAYLKLIGEACRPTSFFIYGPGGSGKSTFTLLLGNYMAQKGNRVLYIAGEQYGTPVFTKMLLRLKIKDTNKFVIVKYLESINPKDFDIVVIDSKDSLGYELEHFKQLREANPKLSFVILSQGTKSGTFTGTEKWRNEVDTLIYCENMTAYTNRDKNRWGGSAEIKINSLIPKI